MKTVTCGDMIPGCHFRASAETEAELMQRVSDHVREAHPEVQMTPALVQSVRGKIRES